MMIHEITNFKRQELFDYYQSRENPFVFLTTRINVTKAYYLGKQNKSMYATLAYFITKAAGTVDAFKYRLEENKIIKYNKLNPNLTLKDSNDNIGWITFEMTDDYYDFIEQYKQKRDEFIQKEITSPNFPNEIWLSYVPWFNFSSLITPFDKKLTTPQIIWDKFIFENNECYVDMMIMVHHGFADGYHIGMFINKLNELIENIGG